VNYDFGESNEDQKWLSAVANGQDELLYLVGFCLFINYYR